MVDPRKRPAKFSYVTPSGEKPFFMIDYGWEESLEHAALKPAITITQDQINVFVEWNGDVDMYQRRKANDPRMFDAAWSTISVLMQMMHIVINHQGSMRYKEVLQADLSALVPDLECQDVLWRLARQGQAPV